ncbi:MAG: ABC transporter ATP-binding protein [Rothia sp. (in: high G+C Gram-positive bacteria)]|uniref:ATP-binding cassette domain-containing protein n=1 Tax=Rothia sp. (in: high G+C Gram-positive bacteria) TaxID=1885016 RepID=UPI0026E102BD|nr:ABC transporter ATP-binding protein [Rothia sp. (in: high G+C Gram-positive bacteria)]MDO5750351.1 ABC transporter ATP-binding protein [Rothia sp. (in: high G+C Gram-positive bacteria)]
MKTRHLLSVWVLTPILALICVAEAPLIGAIGQAIVDSNASAYLSLMGGVLLYILVRVSLHYARQYSATLATAELTNSLRERLMSSIASAPLAQLSKHKPDYYIAQFTSQIDYVKGSYYDQLMWGGYLATQLVLALALAFYTNPLMAALTILLCLPVCALPLLTQKIIGRRAEEYIAATTELTEKSADILRGASEWKRTGHRKTYANLYSLLRARWFSAYRTNSRTQERVDAINTLFTVLLYLGSWAIGGYLVIINLLSLPQLLIFTQLTGMICMPLYSASAIIPELIAGRTALRQLQTAIPTEEKNPATITLDEAEHIRAYSYRDVQLFDSSEPMTLHLETSKKYLVVGASGSGKSTLFKPLLGLNRTYSGTLNAQLSSDRARDCRGLDDKSLNRSVGYLSQSSYIFTDTLRENLRLHDESISDEQIMAACATAGIDGWVNAQGLDYMVSSDLSEMSGGERQRLLLARTLLGSPRFAIIDELTSGLDAGTAASIEQRLLNLPMGMVYISHRMSDELMDSVDEVLVLSQGQIIARGSADDVRDAVREQKLMV